MSQTGAVVSCAGASICGIDGVGEGVGVGELVGVGETVGSGALVVSVTDSLLAATGSSSFLHPVNEAQTTDTVKAATTNILNILLIFMCINIWY